MECRLRAASHLVTGRVTSVEKVTDLQLVVRSQGETKTVDLGDPEEKDGLFYYRFGHQAAPHEEVVLEPKASRHLISPSRLHLLVADDCQLEAAIFTATPGLFVTGDSSMLHKYNASFSSATFPCIFCQFYIIHSVFNIISIAKRCS